MAITPTWGGYRLLAEGFAEALSKAFDEPVRVRYRDAKQWLATLDDKHPVVESPTGHRYQAAGWLLASVAMHPWPQQTLKKVASIAREIIEHSPDEFTGWLFLALTSTQQPEELFLRPDFVQQLGDLRVLHCNSKPIRISRDQLDQLVPQLKSAGTPAEIIAELTRTWSHSAP